MLSYGSVYGILIQEQDRRLVHIINSCHDGIIVPPHHCYHPSYLPPSTSTFISSTVTIAVSITILRVRWYKKTMHYTYEYFAFIKFLTYQLFLIRRTIRTSYLYSPSSGFPSHHWSAVNHSS